MAEKDFPYAVARVRVKELSLLNNQAIEQLVGAGSYEECLHILSEKGWNGGSSDPRGVSLEAILENERKKTWDFVAEILDDLSPFDVFLYQNDFHNLKAAIKMVCSGVKRDHVFLSGGRVAPVEILKACSERDFSLLPENMRQAAEKAYHTFLETYDGQLVDMIVDKAALDAIYEAGNQSGSDLIREYAELVCATSNIKTALRCAMIHKKADFVYEVLAQCGSLDRQSLAKAAGSSVEAVYEYLEKTTYSKAIDTIKSSPSAFEKWCDDILTEKIRPQKSNPFTIAPIAAYILARENEIKTVRVVLLCKKNGIAEPVIRERMRSMYV